MNNLTMEEYEKLSKEEQQKLYDAITEEDKEELRQKTEMLTQALPHALIAKTKKPDLASVSILGRISMEYCKKFKCSLMQFMIELQILEKVFIERSITNEGVGFNEQIHNVPDKLKKKNRENFKRLEKENKKSTGNQMADALKRAGIIKEKEK